LVPYIGPNVGKEFLSIDLVVVGSLSSFLMYSDVAHDEIVSFVGALEEYFPVSGHRQSWP